MSTTAGVWSETTLQNIRERIEAVGFDGRTKLQYQAFIDAFKALDYVNTANISALKVTGKKTTVDIEWVNACGLTVEATAACTIGSGELSSNIETYTLDESYQVDFQVQEYDFYTNDFGFEDAIAKGMLAADARLSEKFVQSFITELNTGKGVNVLTAPYTVAGTDTTIPSANWDSSVYAYFVQAGLMNKFANPAILSGNNLFQNALINNWNAANSDGKGAFAAQNSLFTVFDPLNLTTVNGATNISYMISQGAISWASAPKYATTLQIFDDYRRYSMPSKFVPGLWLNVIIKEVCEDNMTKYNFKVFTDYSVFTNPAGCSATNTGILSFTCA